MRAGYRHFDAALAYGNQEEVRSRSLSILWVILIEISHVDVDRCGLEESRPFCRQA